MSRVERAAVVGAGTMGGEIAQVVAAAGLPVLLKDVDQAALDTGLARAREVSKDEVADEIVARITPTLSYDGFGEVDFVIEAVPEVMGVKQAVLAELDTVVPGTAILASNTSSLSVTEMADATTRPDKVVGFHFFYPASQARLIEVIEGEETSDDTLHAATVFASALRKTPIRCGEAPGFVVNRILNAAASEAWRVAEEEGLDFAEVDKVLTESGQPVGPFWLADLLGLDTVLHVAEHLNEAYGEHFYVSPAMKRLVGEGRLGVKTGQGFFHHG